MAVCFHCGGEKTKAISCRTDALNCGGKLYEPVRWGDEIRWGPFEAAGRCAVCWTPVGGVHHPGCVDEECPACHEQAVMCGCISDGEPEKRRVFACETRRFQRLGTMDGYRTPRCIKRLRRPKRSRPR